MAVRIQFRRGYASEWAASNPVMAEGEVGLELDTGRFKLGDGLTPWNTIAYATGPAGPAGADGAPGATGPQGNPTTVNGHVGASITLTASDVGAVASDEKGAAGGVASLDGSGKIPSSQLPPLAISDTHVVADETAMLALDAQVGDVAIRSDQSKSYILRVSPASTMGNWQEILSPPNMVLSVQGRTGAISLDDLFEPVGAAAAAITAHTSAIDPHGDRAYGNANFVPITDSRLTDTRTPTDDSVSTAKIQSGAVTGSKIAAGAVSNASVATNAGIAITKLGQTGASAGQIPVWDGTAWVPGDITGSASVVRRYATYTTPALAPGASHTTNISLAKSYRLLTATTSVAARVRLYSTVAARDADLSRQAGWDPAWNAGVILDLVTTAALLGGSLSPQVVGSSLEATSSANIPITITNNSSSTVAVTVNFQFIATET